MPENSASENKMSGKPHRARKRFGQHFLTDQNIIHKIIRTINPQPDQTLVEIGPGQGALTYPLLEKLHTLTVIELDRDLIAHLQTSPSHPGKLIIKAADALKFDFCSLAPPAQKLRIVGNLPYNISTPLLFHLLGQLDCIEDMYFMLQKEVVMRMAAEPNSKTYGRLSVMLQWQCEVEHLFDVHPGSFSPPPKVESSIVRLVPRSQPLTQLDDWYQFSQLVNRVFQQRRKTLRNTLRAWLTAEDIQQLGIDPMARPENLCLQDFARLSNASKT